MANFSINNFVGLPNSTDTRLKIYDKSNKLKWIIDPHVAYFFCKSSSILIKIEDKNSLNLDFSSNQEAVDSLVKLNNYKKIITDKQAIPDPSPGRVIFSKSNLNMNALLTANDGDLACDTPILDKPKTESFVRVTVNGLEVNVGGKVSPYDCYFSSNDGVTAKTLGTETTGDKLYWNYSVAKYNLSPQDLIDFIYLIDLI